jgi:DnaJ-class molecular chaperone
MIFMEIECPQCAGEGRIWKSKYGGNDPDVWDAGQCPRCEGAGVVKEDVDQSDEDEDDA